MILDCVVVNRCSRLCMDIICITFVFFRHMRLKLEIAYTKVEQSYEVYNFNISKDTWILRLR